MKLKKKLIILLVATIMVISACTPKQTDSFEITEEPKITEDVSAGEEKESTPIIEDIVEKGPFTEKSTDKLNFSLNAAGLRPQEVWALGDNKVYFGHFWGIPMAYRVLPASPDTQEIENGEDCLLLDCDTVLLPKEYDADNELNEGQTDKQNEWKGSDLEAWLNSVDFLDYCAVFSTIERGAITSTTLAEREDVYWAGRWTYQDTGATDRIFLLSAEEALKLYMDNAARAKTGSNPSWWVRSAFAEASQGAGAVHEDGHICNNSVFNFGNGVSPAFNISLSSILFATTLEEDKEGISGEWQLTLLDNSKSVQITEGQTVTRTDSDEGIVITVPYTYAGTGVTQISVMITDKEYTEDEAQILFYNALQNVKIDNTTGTGVFILPLDFKNQTCEKNYYAYLIAEEVNGDKRTDYASEPYAIAIPAAE